MDRKQLEDVNYPDLSLVNHANQPATKPGNGSNQVYQPKTAREKRLAAREAEDKISCSLHHYSALPPLWNP